MTFVALLVGSMLGGLPPQQTDTTFAVRSGGTLAIDGHLGSIAVKTWDRNEMRVRATHDDGTRVRVRNRDGIVDLESSSRRGPGGPVQYDITVPRSFGIDVEGLNFPVTVDGIQGDVNVENVEGAVTIRGTTGSVDIESVSGAIVVENVRGDVDVNTTNEGIRLSGIRGRVNAETVNGSIIMRVMEATSVEASTVNGTAEYDGIVRDGGRYYLGAYNGRITMSIPERANVSLSVTTKNGKVEAAFPVPVNPLRSGRFSLTLGSGSAQVELESYNGSIHLVRPVSR